MRVILTADTHANNRLPGNLDYSRMLLEDLGTLALAQGCRHVILAGDVLDQKHGLNLPVLLAVNQGLEALRLAGVRVIILPGNHDLPHPEEPYYSPLALLQKNATVLFTPRIVEEKDCLVVLMPWMPPEKYRKVLGDFTRAVMSSPKKRILISHVSLAEGKVSPSNSILQPIRTEDLFPRVYDHVFLGDYHAAQEIAGHAHVAYLGAPIPHTFGDYDIKGPWLFDSEAGARVALDLPRFYPGFQKWVIRSEEDLPLPGYDPRNRNQIHCPLEKLGTVKAIYPDADLHPVETEVVIEGSRVEKAETLHPMDIFRTWREAQGLPKTPWEPLGETYLGKRRTR